MCCYVYLNYHDITLPPNNYLASCEIHCRTAGTTRHRLSPSPPPPPPLPTCGLFGEPYARPLISLHFLPLWCAAFFSAEKHILQKVMM